MLEYVPGKYTHAFYKGERYEVMWYGKIPSGAERVRLRRFGIITWTDRCMVNFIPARPVDKRRK